MNIPAFIVVCVVFFIAGDLLITAVQKLLTKRRRAKAPVADLPPNNNPRGGSRP